MALQDLTPQLRTRLGRMERAVGWFVVLALTLLVFGFAYYVYHTADRKGWFVTKAPYWTYAESATGIKVGDPVMLMGLVAGQITRMDPMDPEEFKHNIYVEFEIKAPYYGYLWTEGSRAKVTTADFLGKRVLEVTKGTGGQATYIFNPLREVTLAEAQGIAGSTNWVLAQEVYDATGTNLVASPKWPLTNLTAIAAAGCTNLWIMDRAEEHKSMTGIWNDQEGRYMHYTVKSKPYQLISDESAAVTERLEKLVAEVEAALPNILGLTNLLKRVLSNSSEVTSNLNVAVLDARPAVSNLAKISAQLDRPGGLGEWLLPTNILHQVESTLGSANTTLDTANTTLNTANTNLEVLVENLGRSLDNLANLTSNLNVQVQSNTNILSEISRAIVDADSFIQGLKRHWLLRSAFRNKAGDESAASPPTQLSSPKQRSK
jgi:ABC-type transporter Mla subunit MlaD